MAEYEAAAPEQDFLFLSYSEIDFFVNRTQFSGSTSLDGVSRIGSPLQYLDSVFTFNNRKILLFNCDEFLRQTYNCTSGGGSRLCLLMRMENFTPKIRSHIGRLTAKNSRLSGEYIGLIITSCSEIKKLEIGRIYLSPQGIRRHLSRFGLYGCRFPDEGRIQYFIDLEIIIFNILRGRSL